MDFLRLIEEYIISLDPPPQAERVPADSLCLWRPSLRTLGLWGLSLESFSLDIFCLTIFHSISRWV